MWGISSWIWVSNFLVAGGLIGWGIAWSITVGREKMKRWLRKRRLLRNSVSMISKAVWLYANNYNRLSISEWGGGSNNPDYEKFRVRMHIATSILPEIIKWQDLFDQILKMYAECLQDAYDREDEFKRAERSFKPNSIDRPFIDARLHVEKHLAEAKKTAEREFWDLHDTLQYLGLKIWDSYKMYLKLKPMEDFPILNQ